MPPTLPCPEAEESVARDASGLSAYCIDSVPFLGDVLGEGCAGGESGGETSVKIACGMRMRGIGA